MYRCVDACCSVYERLLYDMFDVFISRLMLYDVRDVVVVVDRKPSRSSPTFGFDMVRRATASQMERARELLEIQQKRGVPLFGKGSGRGRKKSVTAPCMCIYLYMYSTSILLNITMCATIRCI